MAGVEETGAGPACKALGFGALCSYSDVLAILFLVFVGIVFFISYSLHFLEHWIERRFDKLSKAGLGAALQEAVERIKEEFMITGIIALLLFAFGRKLEDATCTHRKEPYPDTYISVYGSAYTPPSLPGMGDKAGSEDGGHGRRLLAGPSNCLHAHVPFLQQEHAHILLLLAALVNAVYSISTIVITIKRIQSWNKFEERMQDSAELQPLGNASIKYITSNHHSANLRCIFSQFYIPFLWKGVSYDSYKAARYCAMEYWKPLMCKQMLLKARDQAATVLQQRIIHAFRAGSSDIGATVLKDANNTVGIDVDKLVSSAKKSIEETEFLANATSILQDLAADDASHHNLLSADERKELLRQQQKIAKRFDAAYRLKVKHFDYNSLLTRLAAEQFAEDRLMAFLQPAIIGVFLLIPHDARVFAWYPPIVFAIMLFIGWYLQRIQLELTSRYYHRYTEEYKKIKARLRWRATVAKVVETKVGPQSWLAQYKVELPLLTEAKDERAKHRIVKRMTSWHVKDKADSSQHFFGSPKLMQRIFVFCYYSNAFFLGIALFTAWIQPHEFVQRRGLMVYLIFFSIASMLHGALNITPLFALITSSSSHLPPHFAEKVEEEQNKLRTAAQATRALLDTVRDRPRSLRLKSFVIAKDVEAGTRKCGCF